MKFSIGELVWSIQHKKEAKVLSVNSLWGKNSYEIIIPEEKEILWVQEEALKELQSFDNTADYISYLAIASKIEDTLGQNVLVSPFEAPVIPLPHQLKCLKLAMAKDRVRYLLADEVGLGKTIEAGLIIKELKSRGLVKRILIVAPTGLAYQWVGEMKNRFNEKFSLMQPKSFTELRNSGLVEDHDNIWEVNDQVICTLDSVKPLESRKGWSQEKVDEYNQERFDSLISSNWDLVVIDEAHRLSGSTDSVARYKLGEGLANATPYILLLSATPHQGKSDSFCRLMSFLDKDTFSDEYNITKNTVSPFVIRTEKRLAIDTDGNPLFKDRKTTMVSAKWNRDDFLQYSLYEGLTKYIKGGYNRALEEKQTAYGFLMVLFQRMVSSSTRAIRTTLEKRLEILQKLKEDNNQLIDMSTDWEFEDDIENMTDLLSINLKDLKFEIEEVEKLSNLAISCENKGPDRKFLELLNLIHLKQQEENIDVKILIFTEFVATQQMLKENLSSRGYSVQTLNGSMDMDDRRKAISQFAESIQILVATEAGGEGLNMQFCHIIINYDLPWNPMKLEQRIGRVDRIGQPHTVQAYNLTIADTVEDRVREVLENKLTKILEEYGANKLNDVLDSDAPDIDFNGVFSKAVVDERAALHDVDELIRQIKVQMSRKKRTSSVLGSIGALKSEMAKEVERHPIGRWVQEMVFSYIKWNNQNGAKIEQGEIGFNIYWPTGEFSEDVTFDRLISDTYNLDILSLESSLIQELLENNIPQATSDRYPKVYVPEISEIVQGTWSLWRVSLHSDKNKLVRYFPLFESEKGKFFKPTAEKIWSNLISKKIKFTGELFSINHDKIDVEANCVGEEYYRLLLDKHNDKVNRKISSKDLLFKARQRAIKQIGLETVRNYRQKQHNLEVSAWEEEVFFLKQAAPKLERVITLYVGKDND